MYFESRCEHHVAHHVAQFCVEIEYLTASLGCSQIHHFLPLASKTCQDLETIFISLV